MRRHERPQLGIDAVPPFWIKPTGRGGHAVNRQVIETSEQLWPWAYRHVEMVLHDAPSAAEILETVAIDVSARLQSTPEVASNLRGYLITAFRRRVRLEFLRDSRLAYEGLLRELETKHPLLAHDWATAVEFRFLVGHLTALMSDDARRIVYYRLLSFNWEEIAEANSISVSQARNKYYYGVKSAYDRLVTEAAKRRGEEETT
jgi:hypothetical protein